MSKRTKSFVWGAIAAAAGLVLGIWLALGSSGSAYIIAAIFAISVFTLVSCLVLDNNFIGDTMLSIYEWSFVKMPGLIFTLDLDGIVWLLTVKLIFWILGIILAIICGILAFVIGLLCSLFVYPFALYRSFTEKEEFGN